MRMSMVYLSALISFLFVLGEKEASELCTFDSHQFDHDHPISKDKTFPLNAREYREKSALL